jgi:hypothetical protein
MISAMCQKKIPPVPERIYRKHLKVEKEKKKRKSQREALFSVICELKE